MYSNIKVSLMLRQSSKKVRLKKDWFVMFENLKNLSKSILLEQIKSYR